MTNSLNLHYRKLPLLANQMAVWNEWMTQEEYPRLLNTKKRRCFHYKEQSVVGVHHTASNEVQETDCSQSRHCI